RRIQLTGLFNLNLTATTITCVDEGITRTLKSLGTPLGTGKKVLPRAILGIGEAKQSVQSTFNDGCQSTTISIRQCAGRRFHQPSLYPLQLQVHSIQNI